MTNREINLFLAKELMGWIAPEPTPPGRYISIQENEEFGIGQLIGYRHEETGIFYTLKEFEKFEYWQTADGKPAKAPWGGLMSRSAFLRWQPTNDISQVIGGLETVVGRMTKKGYGFHFHLHIGESYTACSFSNPFDSFHNLISYECLPAEAICRSAVRALGFKEDE